MNSLLQAKEIEKTFEKGNAQIQVLKDLEMDVLEGQSISVVGASGVGKSTLLNILGGLDQPSRGQVLFRGEDVFSRSSKKLAEFRNRSIGFIFQFHYLLPEFTALENVMMPLLMRREDAGEVEEKAEDALIQVGLEERLLHRPAELSGGEQQRVAIARALVGDPALILADEPTGNLDVDTARTVGDLLFSVVSEKRRSMIVATHNPELAMRADRVLRMKGGHLSEEAAA